MHNHNQAGEPKTFSCLVAFTFLLNCISLTLLPARWAEDSPPAWGWSPAPGSEWGSALAQVWVLALGLAWVPGWE